MPYAELLYKLMHTGAIGASDIEYGRILSPPGAEGVAYSLPV